MTLLHYESKSRKSAARRRAKINFRKTNRIGCRTRSVKHILFVFSLFIRCFPVRFATTTRNCHADSGPTSGFFVRPSHRPPRPDAILSVDLVRWPPRASFRPSITARVFYPTLVNVRASRAPTAFLTPWLVTARTRPRLGVINYCYYQYLRRRVFVVSRTNSFSRGGGRGENHRAFSRHRVGREVFRVPRRTFIIPRRFDSANTYRAERKTRRRYRDAVV